MLHNSVSEDILSFSSIPLKIEEEIHPGGQSCQCSSLPVPGTLGVHQQRHHEHQRTDRSGPVHVVRKISQIIHPLPKASHSSNDQAYLNFQDTNLEKDRIERFKSSGQRSQGKMSLLKMVYYILNMVVHLSRASYCSCINVYSVIHVYNCQQSDAVRFFGLRDYNAYN